jgi:hypothetical protein
MMHIITNLEAYLDHLIEEQATATGYELIHVAGFDMFAKWGRTGGHLLVVKDGLLLARFDGWRKRAAWLRKLLDEGSVTVSEPFVSTHEDGANKC